MSSMRNAVQRRNHKERAQPKQREKWGLLEKHKDYSLRAKDFNEKKKRLKILRQKAADRNPDEFHFAMMSSKTDSRGVKIADRGNQVLSNEAVALLKTQDAGYLRTMAQRTRKAIERLQQSLTLDKTEDGEFVPSIIGDDGGMGVQHVTFAENAEEQRAWVEQIYRFSEALADELQDDPQGSAADSSFDESEDEEPRPTKASIKRAAEGAKRDKILRKRRRRDQEVRQTTLRILQKREKDLRSAEARLEVQRSKMSGGHGIGVTKKGLKFKSRARKK